MYNVVALNTLFEFCHTANKCIYMYNVVALTQEHIFSSFISPENLTTKSKQLHFITCKCLLPEHCKNILTHYLFIHAYVVPLIMKDALQVTKQNIEREIAATLKMAYKLTG